LIDYRRLSTPITPLLRFRLLDAPFPNNGHGVHGTDREIEKNEFERE